MELIETLKTLVTETRNPATMEIDTLDTLALVTVINSEDKKVAPAVEQELANIAKAVDVIVAQMELGGRLVYCGAGTSGRLGVLDASECPPTYGVDFNTVVGLIAGGKEALFAAKEGAEDSLTLCREDLIGIDFTEKDVLVGIAASGRTPYVLGGFEYAKSLGAHTIAVTCNPGSAMAQVAEISIAPVVGPEVVTGSTRMKSGTAQKLVLNMLSTATMIKLGKVYGNLMVDVKTSNEKLVERAKKIVIEATGVTYERATELLSATGDNVKLAILVELSGLDVTEARTLLDGAKGRLRVALDKAGK